MKTIEIADAADNNPKLVSGPVIVMEHLFKKFGTNIVLEDFSLSVEREENVVVLGKSGAGKSVLIKCIIGLLKPDKGKIMVFGEDITVMDEDELAKARMKIGFLFQANAIYDSMTVRENLEFPLRRHWTSLDEKEVDEMVKEALENVGLIHTSEMMPSELSGGMLKRIALARTLILKPEIILYDEPTTGLDPVTAREIDQLILTLQKKYNTSSIIISHDMNCVRNIADRVILLLEGRCYADGTYKTLESSSDPKINQFFQ
ncbi:ABC transporter ATP-binding protein [Pedobacter mucosus]|uniref:ABC transporter ATP-binding protein n=1 Tax=Pedobacter mucosus TaxID=2895286 RepID=UPI001EE3BF96|nr:ATP-binding cassette domain-containing protein [Pedobacter mucosus]UKT64734.1 ATP-binding cassette domain-containing protein [Pedobacter mucosus]